MNLVGDMPSPWAHMAESARTVRFRRLAARPVPRKAKVVDATLWIAVFSSNFAYQRAIAESAIARASDIGVRLLIEDSSRLDGDGVPLKIWLND